MNTSSKNERIIWLSIFSTSSEIVMLWKDLFRKSKGQVKFVTFALAKNSYNYKNCVFLSVLLKKVTENQENLNKIDFR